MPLLNARVLPAVVAVVAVWVVAGVVLFFLQQSRPTPEKVAAYLAKNPIAAAAKRSDILESVARQLNGLDFEQRQELRRSGELRNFFEALTPEERSRFLDLTLPEGMSQLMTALNKMDAERRKRIVNRILDDLRRDSPEIANRINDADVQKIITQGLSSFFEEADADVKLDFAPVIEELQNATRNLR
ncbi:MAG: hypothetical protein SFU53_01995 [Terrimicrobiaceae bacterium]|nr:hypothetical protein [Terrimicrobiaceae bacterium]